MDTSSVLDVPPLYDGLVGQCDVVGVEEARGRWGALVAAAETGTITLITRERWEVAALVPVNEVTDSLNQMPVWSLSIAKAKLGELVRAAGNYPPVAHLLARRGRPVAALIAARHLVDRPAAADRIDVDQLLQDGHTIVLGFDPGEPGSVDRHGDVVYPPVPECYWAEVRDRTGSKVASGAADTITEALLRIQPTPHLAARSDDIDGEPPF